jgi:hypothetical protein
MGITVNVVSWCRVLEDMYTVREQSFGGEEFAWNGNKMEIKCGKVVIKGQVNRTGGGCSVSTARNFHRTPPYTWL